jgi:hypothetical protein
MSTLTEGCFADRARTVNSSTVCRFSSKPAVCNHRETMDGIKREEGERETQRERHRERQTD